MRTVTRHQPRPSGETSRSTFDLMRPLKRRLRAAAVQHDTDMISIVEAALTAWLDAQEDPSAAYDAAFEAGRQAGMAETSARVRAAINPPVVRAGLPTRPPTLVVR